MLTGSVRAYTTDGSTASGNSVSTRVLAYGMGVRATIARGVDDVALKRVIAHLGKTALYSVTV
jgi:hypothetical protein